jgi:GT2 family glycosyltransferase
LEENALQEMLKFLDSRELAAMCGPFIENEFGEFQSSSRRGLPTPANSLGRLFGIERLFPSGKFGSYSLLHISPEREMKIEAISGACMLIRTSDYRAIGGFDEDYFLFGEDLDLCWKLGQLNREIWYVPSAKVMHIKGASVRFNFSRSRKEFFRAMDIYIDKRLQKNYSSFSRFLMKVGLRVRRIMDPLLRG